MNIIDAKDFAKCLNNSGVIAEFKSKAKFLTTGGFFAVKVFENTISQENGKVLYRPYGNKGPVLEVEIKKEKKKVMLL